MAIKALTNIRHDGKRYVPGDVIVAITDEQSQRLIDVGAAEQAPDNAKASNGKAVNRVSNVKERILKAKNSDPSKRKTLVEKAQARQKKADNTVEAKVIEPNDSNDNSTPDDQGDKYEIRNTKKGNPKYYKNGKEIKKIDYFTGIKKD